jgi:predicted Zn-dependent peptidase
MDSPLSETTQTRTRRPAARRGALDPELTTVDIDGVPLVWAKSPGLKRVALSFRVGFNDERLHERGLTHCCEHLALRQFKDEPFMFNGFTEAARTVFYAQGTDKQLLHFARGVTTALGALPEGEYARERRVLLAESSARTGNDVDSLLRLRYGARGPGAASYTEYGLYNHDFGAVTDWAQKYFTASNAVAWCSGTPPRGLHFLLERGSGRIEAPLPTPIDEERPFFFRRDGGIAIGVPNPTSPDNYLATVILERRLRDRLRHEASTTYSVETVSVRLGLDLSHLSIHADVGPRQANNAVDEFERVLDDLVTNGPDDSDFAAWNAVRDQVKLHADVIGPLDSASQRLLHGGKPMSLKAWDARIRRVKKDDVAAAVRRIRDDAIFLLPSDAKPMRDVGPLRVDSPFVVAGPGVAAKDAKDEQLVVGREGVTLKAKQGNLTVRAGEAEAVLMWADESRLIVGSDAIAVAVVPNRWPEDVPAKVEEVFADVPHVRVGRRYSVPTGARPLTIREVFSGASLGGGRRSSFGLVRSALLAFMCAVSLVATFEPDPEFGVGDRMVTALMALAFGFFAVRVFRRSRSIGRPGVRSGTWVLDEARAHLDAGRVPTDLPVTAAFTVGGMLLGWLQSRGLTSDWFRAESGDLLEQFASGQVTGPALYQEWDGVLASDMLSQRGAKFCAWYFSENDRRFTEDITRLRASRESNYHIPDDAASQAAFDKMADVRLEAWSRSPWNKATERRTVNKLVARDASAD